MGKECWWKAASHVVPLLTTEWSLLLHTPRQRLPMLFNGQDNPKIAASHGKISTPFNTWFFGPTESARLDRLSRFCRAHPCDQRTYRQTTLRATAVAIGRILKCAFVCTRNGLKPGKICHSRRYCTAAAHAVARWQTAITYTLLQRIQASSLCNLPWSYPAAIDYYSSTAIDAQ